jgi:quinol-cytochrome oxidoreductase complex cytochrome b subunit
MSGEIVREGQGWGLRLAFVAALLGPVVLLYSCWYVRICWPIPETFCASIPQTVCDFCTIVFGPKPVYDVYGPPLIPEWYMRPVFAILRSVTFDLGDIPAKSLGFIVLCSAYAAPLSLAAYRWPEVPVRAWISLVGVPLLIAVLGWAGGRSPLDPIVMTVGQIATVLYFLWFTVVFPLLARRYSATESSTFSSGNASK